MLGVGGIAVCPFVLRYHGRMKPDDKPTDSSNNYMPKLTDAQIDAVLKEMKEYLQLKRAVESKHED